MRSSNRIVTPLAVRKRCLWYASQPTPIQYDPGKWGAQIGHLNDAVKQLNADGQDVTNENRRLILGFLFTPIDRVFQPMHSDQLTPQQKYAVERWIGAVLTDEKWIPSPTFKAEANWILNLALYFQAMLLSNGGNGIMDNFLTNYLIEAGMNEDWVGADYWLKLALELPGGIVTRMYQEGAEDDPGMLPYNDATDVTPPREQEAEWKLEFSTEDLDQFTY